MNREEFITKLAGDLDDGLGTALWVCDSNDCIGQSYPDGLKRLSEIAADVAEPLFEYIENLEKSEDQKIAIIKDLEDRLLKAENDRAYWFDLFGLEKHTTLEMAKRIEAMQDVIDQYQSRE